MAKKVWWNEDLGCVCYNDMHKQYYCNKSTLDCKEAHLLNCDEIQNLKAIRRLIKKLDKIASGYSYVPYLVRDQTEVMDGIAAINHIVGEE